MHVREERVLEYFSDCVAAWWVIDCPCCRCEFVWLLSRIPSKILKMYFSRCIYINMHINLRKWLPRKKIRVEVGCVVWGSVLLRAWVVWVVGWRSSYINNVSSHCLMTRGATKIVDWHHVTLQYKDRRIINKTQKTEKKTWVRADWARDISLSSIAFIALRRVLLFPCKWSGRIIIV